MTIGFSIPVYHDPIRVKKQLYCLEAIKGDMNFLYALHVNQKNDLEEFHKVLKKDRRLQDKIFFLSTRFPLSKIDNFFNVHVLNFKMLQDRIDCFCLSAANEAYFRGGKYLESIFRDYECGFFNSHTEHPYSRYYYAHNESFRNSVDFMGVKKFIGSQWEGNFFNKDIFSEVAKVIDKNFDLNRHFVADGNGNMDETVFCTLASAISDKVFYPLCRVDHLRNSDYASIEKVKFLSQTGKDLKLGQERYFCSIKRVPVENHLFINQIMDFLKIEF